MNGQKWTEEMDSFLINNYMKMKFENIAIKLGVSKNSVYYRAKVLNISFKKSPKWSDDDISYLISNFYTKSSKDMSRYLKRSGQAVRDKSLELGLNKNNCRTLNEYIEYENHYSIKIYYSNNFVFTYIDKDDYARCNKSNWNYDPITNSVSNTNKIKLHRFIMNVEDKDVCIDHIDRNPLNNIKENLRMCTQAENMQNLGISKLNTSGYRGVYYDKTYRKWYSKFKTKNVKAFFGYFETKEECNYIAKNVRAYCMPFSSDANEIKQEDIPQWIKDKIDNKLLSKGLELKADE